jgi:hypothetical protein
VFPPIQMSMQGPHDGHRVETSCVISGSCQWRALFFYFLMGLGFELKALQLHALYHLSHTSSPF